MNKIIGSQYIMLFDEKGAEITCSKDYIGFTLGTEPEDSTYDFRRLLLGVEQIIHEACIDERTGIMSEMIGVRLPLKDGQVYGACLLAMDPNELSKTTVENRINSTMLSLASPGTFFVGVDPVTGIILYSDNEKYIGTDATNLGIIQNNLRDDVVDFFTLKGESYYGVSQEVNGVIYFYFVQMTLIRATSLVYILTAVFGFAVIYLIVALIVLKGYDKQWFEQYAVVGKRVFDGTRITVVLADGRKKKTIDPSKRWELLPEIWQNMLPEEKAKVVNEILMALLIFMIGASGRISGSRIHNSTLMGFLMNGQWTRGLNLFAFVSIAYMTIASALFLIILRCLCALLCLFLGTRGETICRLILNLIQYLAIIVLLYYAFSYLGFDTSGLIASLGLISLAISLGSKDLVSDIVAGMTIVFEGEFQVGDMVDISGYRGKVQEIGARSTKLIGRGENIKIIGNRDVKNVINLTRLNSWYPVELCISTAHPLEEVEKILERELPKIGASIDEIISGPYYKGVLGFRNGAMMLSVITECLEENYHKVQRKVNRELRLLFEREGINLL